MCSLIDLTSQSRSRQQVSFSGQAGTPLYMSPEQLEHTRCTEKVDIYALGVIYFEMNYVTVHEKHKVNHDIAMSDMVMCPNQHFFCAGTKRSSEGFSCAT